MAGQNDNLPRVLRFRHRILSELIVNSARSDRNGSAGAAGSLPTLQKTSDLCAQARFRFSI